MDDTQKESIANKVGIDSWDLSAWIEQLGSVPVERLRHEDHSESYEMSVAHLFRLENGKYAVVIEEGCSCYSSSDAQIEVFPSLERAEASFNEWEKPYANR